MRQFPAWTVCSHNFHVLDEADGRLTPRASISDAIDLCSPEDLIRDNLPGNMSASMYRRSVLEHLPGLIGQANCGDWLLNICAASAGSLAFMHRPMSVYRRTQAGLWSGLSRIAQLELLPKLIPEYDGVTGHHHHEAFRAVEAGYQAELADLQAGPALVGES